MSGNAPDSKRLLLDRLTRLPELTDTARASGEQDLYAELERLKREHDAAKQPYRFSMPYRHPPRACSSGVHSVPSVKHTLVNPARKKPVELWEAEWHEAEMHGAALPAAVVRFLQDLEESGAAAPAMPQSLEFAFGAVRLSKQGEQITLTVMPVWTDAQTGPPPGFEENFRTRQLSVEEFAVLWRELGAIDLARYARLTDADFEPTPPDLRHFERLTYVVDGKEIVSWGRSYERLRPALRQPLIALEQRAHAWAKAHPAAERPHAPFERLVLRDVQGLEGGRNVYVDADGSVTVQVVTPAETGLHEKRYQFRLSDEHCRDFNALLVKHPLGKVRIPARPGVPDQARPEITLQRSGDRSVAVAKWDDDRHPDFDAVYAYLLGLEKTAQERTPVRDGVYEPDWRPE